MRSVDVFTSSQADELYVQLTYLQVNKQTSYVFS